MRNRDVYALIKQRQLDVLPITVVAWAGREDGRIPNPRRAQR